MVVTPLRRLCFTFRSHFPTTPYISLATYATYCNTLLGWNTESSPGISFGGAVLMWKSKMEMTGEQHQRRTSIGGAINADYKLKVWKKTRSVFPKCKLDFNELSICGVKKMKHTFSLFPPKNLILSIFWLPAVSVVPLDAEVEGAVLAVEVTEVCVREWDNELLRDDGLHCSLLSNLKSYRRKILTRPKYVINK